MTGTTSRTQVRNPGHPESMVTVTPRREKPFRGYASPPFLGETGAAPRTAEKLWPQWQQPPPLCCVWVPPRCC